jgi:hypothetical protein
MNAATKAEVLAVASKAGWSWLVHPRALAAAITRLGSEQLRYRRALCEIKSRSVRLCMDSRGSRLSGLAQPLPVPDSADPWLRTRREMGIKTRAVVTCPSCSASGKTACGACSGSEAVECAGCWGSDTLTRRGGTLSISPRGSIRSTSCVSQRCRSSTRQVSCPERRNTGPEMRSM